MALFAFIDLKPATATPELRAALQVPADEPLLARRLRGTGKWDMGRRAVEIVVPSRIPERVNLRAGGLLCGNVDFVAPHFKYGEYHEGDLRERYQADELVVLHDWARYEGPEYAPDPSAPDGLVLVSDSEEEHYHPFAVQAFFDRLRPREVLDPLRQLYGRVRRAYLASRPGDRWWLNIGRF